MPESEDPVSAVDDRAPVIWVRSGCLLGRHGADASLEFLQDFGPSTPVEDQRARVDQSFFYGQELPAQDRADGCVGHEVIENEGAISVDDQLAHFVVREDRREVAEPLNEGLGPFRLDLHGAVEGGVGMDQLGQTFEALVSGRGHVLPHQFRYRLAHRPSSLPSTRLLETLKLIG